MELTKRLAKLLWLTGGVLIIMVFVYQATPILLNLLGSSWLTTISIFLFFFGMSIAVLCATLLFSWLFEELSRRKSELSVLNEMRQVALRWTRSRLEKRENVQIKVLADINGQQISLDASSQENARELLEQFQSLHPTIEETTS